MSATVDERIVAAKFDASDFEKGVNKTIKKLDELKKSLDMKDTTKSVNELSEKVKTSTDSMSSSLDKLTNRLTTFTGMIKQQILSGLAQEVSDVFLKMERAVTGFVRSLGSEQVSAGMAKYEQMLSSVRTMIAAGETQTSAYEAIEQLRDYSDQTSYSLSQMTDALSKFRAAGVGLEEATRSVEGIANACATAGVNAVDAQRAFYNLSQAYSSGTLKYTDYRSLELLNMTTEKFKNNMLEAAEEAGTLKRLADGTYKTIAKKGEKITAGKKVTVKNIQDALKYGFVTKDVMNKLFGGKYYFTEKEFKKYKNKYTDEHGNLTEEGRQKAIADAKKDFNEYAVDAYLAAREARNFTDVINTLKDVVSTGWSTTFEHLFGKLEDATKFFTQLTEGPLADVIYKIGEYRNAILGYWNAVDTASEGTGAQMLQNIILNISDALGTLLKTFQQILPGFDELDNEEGEAQTKLQAIGESLRSLTSRIMVATLEFKASMESFNTWMNSPIFKGGPTRIELIRKSISNLLTVFSIGYKVFSVAFNAVVKLIEHASPIFDALSIAFEKITEPLAELDKNQKPFKDLEHSANNLLMILDPIIKGLTAVLGVVGEIGKFFVEMAIDSVTMNLEFFSDVLRFFIDLFTDGKSSQSLEEGKSTLDGIREAFEGIKDACTKGLGAVKEFLGSLIKDLRALFGLTDENGEKIQNGGVFENLKNFFDNNQFLKDAKAWVDQAIIDVGNFIKSIPARLKAIGTNIYDTLYGLFFKEETKYNGSTLETKTVLTPLGEWMDKVIKDVKKFFVNLPDNIIKGIGKVFGWIDTLFNSIFGVTSASAESDKGKTDAKKEEKKVTSRFDTFLSTITNSIKQWFNDMPNKIRKAMKSIGNFAKKLINTIDEFLFGKKVVKMAGFYYDKDGKKHINLVTTRIKSGFSLWLDGIISEIKKFIKNIPEYIKTAITGAGDIISTVVNALFGRDDSSATQDPSKKVEEEIKKPFLGIDWTSVWNTIKEIGQTLLNQVARIFTGTDDIEVNSEWFAKAVRDGIEWVRTQAELGFKWISEFIPTIPTRIANWFKGEEKTSGTPKEGTVGKAIYDFAHTVGEFIAGIPGMLTEFATNAITAIGGIWDRIYDAILGGDGKNKPKRASVNKHRGAIISPDKVYTELTGEESGDRGPWNDFVEKLGKLISTAFEQLPTFVMQGVDLALKGLNELISKIGSWFTSEDGEKIQNDSKDSAEKAIGKVADGTDQGGNASKTRLQQVFDNIGETLKDLITKTIPEAISNAFTWLASLGSQIWEGIEAVFDDTKTVDGETSPVAKAVETFGESIKKKLTGEDGSKGIMGWINDAFTWIVGKGESIWTGIQNIFEGHPQGAFQTALHDFGVWIGDVVSIEIPKAINTAFEALGNLFSPKMETKNNDYELRNVGDDYITQRIAYMKKSNKKATDEVNKPGFWSFIDSIATSMTKAFADIGPVVLNALSDAFDWLSKVGDSIVSLLTGNDSIGDSLEKAYGEEKPELAASLTRIGDSLKTFFVSTLPKILGSAIVEVSKYASEFWSNFIGSFSKGVEAASKQEDLSEFDGAAMTLDGKLVNVDNPEDKETFFGKLIGVFNTIADIASNSKVQGIVLIIALAILLKHLKQAMSIADEVDAVSGTFKWVAVTAAIAAIGYIMGSIVDIIKTGDKDKIDAAERMLDKVGGFLEKFAWIMGLMAAGKIATAIGDIGSATAENGGLIGSLVGGLGGFLTTAGTALGINIGADLIGDAVKSLSADVISVVTDIVASIDTMMEFINPFIDKVTNAGNKVDNAITAVGKIKDLYVELYKAFESLYQDIGGDILGGFVKDDSVIQTTGPDYYITDVNGERLGSTVLAELSMKAFLESFDGVVDIYADIATFLNSLADALEKVGNIDNIETKIESIQTLLTSQAFTNLISKVFGHLYTLFNDIMKTKYFKYPEEGLRVSANLGTAFSCLGSIMTTIVAALNGLDADKSTNFTQAMELLKTIAESFDKSGKDLSLIGNRISLFGYYMRDFFGYISEMKGFGDEEVKITNAKIDAVIKIVEHMADCASLLDQYGGGFKFLPDLGMYISSMGGSFAGFMTQLDTALPKDISDDRINTISLMTSSIAALLGSFGQLGSIIDPSALHGKGYYGELLDSLFRNLDDAINDPKNNKLAGISGGLYNIVNTPLTSQEAYEHYHSAGANIARELYTGMQAALDNPDNHYNPKITPVIDMDSMDTQLGDYFKNNSFNPEINSSMVVGLNAQTDAKLDAIKETLNAINSGIKDLKDNTATVDDVSKAIGGWTIKTNTNALVGVMTPAIDEAIGERIWLIQRKNSV